MTPRRQPPMVYVVLAVLLVGGAMFVFLHKGRQLSGQADTALTAQAERDRQMRQVDASLVKWREVRRVPTGLQQPSCFGVAGADIWVGGDRMLKGPRGVQYPLSFDPSCFLATSGLDVASRDTVYRLDMRKKQLVPVTPNLGPRAYLTGLAADAKSLWAADSGNRRLLHLDKSGKIIGTVGKGQLIAPSPHLKVLLKPDGNLLVNNPGRLRVDTFSPDGTLKSSFGKAAVDIDGFCGCCNPIDIALLPAGQVVTAEKGLPRVKVYKADGTLESVVVGPEGLSPRCEPQIAVTPQGQILVLDPPAHVVRVFERNK
jgi:hypothetical protein